MAASVLWRWAVDADEMRREAAACRLLAKSATPVCAARLLTAADEWDKLAQIADACRGGKAEAGAGAKPKDDDAQP
jgi:hypothetical protein